VLLHSADGGEGGGTIRRGDPVQLEA
jgi:hypothetical protein